MNHGVAVDMSPISHGFRPAVPHQPLSVRSRFPRFSGKPDARAFRLMTSAILNQVPLGVSDLVLRAEPHITEGNQTRDCDRKQGPNNRS